MQKYRFKTLGAEISDRLLRAACACGIGIGWFILLWGLSLPALTAGVSLGVMLWLCMRQFSRRMTMKREKQMRQMIGGELALDRLLLETPQKAGFLCAVWLAPSYPLVMHKALDWAVTGVLDEKKTSIRLIAQHRTQKITVQQVVECAREAREQQLDQMILCLTAPAEPQALAYAAALDPPVRIVERSELTAMAGLAHPATDEDLRSIRRQRKKRRSAKEWLAVILDASRARRYFWYGTGLFLFALWTGSVFYPLPAAVCLGLFAGCKLRQLTVNRRRHWTG